METTITENEIEVKEPIVITPEMRLEAYYSLGEAWKQIEQNEHDEMDNVLTPEIKAQLEVIRLKYKEPKESIVNELARLESEIKADVLTSKSTIRSKNVMAVWNKGRTSWDGKLLDGMAKLEPKLLAARKEGEPTVSIRFNK